MVTSDDGKSALPIPDNLPLGQSKPAIVTTKTIKLDDKTTRVTTTMIPVQDLPDDHEFTSEDLKESKYPGFDSIPEGDTKSCRVTIDNIPDGNKMNTVSLTKVPIEEKPLSINFPGFGSVYTEDAQPCVIALETIKDGDKKTVISTTVTATKDIPGSDVPVPLHSKAIDISSFVNEPEESKPGIMAVRTIDDSDRPLTITATTIIDDDESRKADEIPRDEKETRSSYLQNSTRW